MKAVLIDDEDNCLKVLAWEIKQLFPEIEILALCNSPQAGIEAIQTHQPDIVFLDVEMPHMSGFDMLAQLPDYKFDVIFTTAYDAFALKAIKVSAVDYLLKPIDEDELKKAVEKVKARKQENLGEQQVEFLMQRIKESLSKGAQHIAMPTFEGLEFIELEDIVYCQSDSNYTRIIRKSGSNLIVSKTLKDVELLLPEERFLRVHQSYTVNLNHIRKFVKAEGGYLVMSNNDEVRVARSKKELILKLF
jgi:two-component system LytT family response regulator